MCRLVPEATLLTKGSVSKAVCRSLCPKWDDTSNSGGGDDAFLLILTCNKFGVLTTYQHSRWCFICVTSSNPTTVRRRCNNTHFTAKKTEAQGGKWCSHLSAGKPTGSELEQQQLVWRLNHYTLLSFIISVSELKSCDGIFPILICLLAMLGAQMGPVCRYSLSQLNPQNTVLVAVYSFAIQHVKQTYLQVHQNGTSPNLGFRTAFRVKFPNQSSSSKFLCSNQSSECKLPHLGPRVPFLVSQLPPCGSIQNPHNKQFPNAQQVQHIGSLFHLQIVKPSGGFGCQGVLLLQLFRDSDSFKFVVPRLSRM